jgi:hypothetical protein
MINVIFDIAFIIQIGYSMVQEALMNILKTAHFTGSLVIFEHPAVMYQYSPALSIHHMNDARLNDLSTYLDLHLFISVFNEIFEKALQSTKSIITVPYTSLMAKTVDAFLAKYFSQILDNWMCFTFIHNDDDTKKIPLFNRESALEYKLQILDELPDFPYIKRIEIPYNFLLTYPSLYQIIETNIEYH